MITSVDLYRVIREEVRRGALNIHTAVVAVVTAVNENTINCKPAISSEVDGRKVDLPELIEVPPLFMQGGGSYTAHPIAVGDSCLLIISERCFDNWYDGKNYVLPPEFRAHDYSDAFAIVGVNPLAAAIKIPEITTHFGDVKFEGDMQVDGNVEVYKDVSVDGDVEAGTFTSDGEQGITGVFPNGEGQTLRFVNGIVVEVS